MNSLIGNAIDSMHGRRGIHYLRERDGRDWRSGKEYCHHGCRHRIGRVKRSGSVFRLFCRLIFSHRAGTALSTSRSPLPPHRSCWVVKPQDYFLVLSIGIVCGPNRSPKSGIRVRICRPNRRRLGGFCPAKQFCRRAPSLARKTTGKVERSC